MPERCEEIVEVRKKEEEKMKDKFSPLKKFWEDATEGWNTIIEVGKGILSLIIIIIAAPLALIGACKREWRKKWMK